ncbi:glutathione S-transferase D7 [Phlebotomus argentipes]|uniref:glutathione S-transferase D7 n=1 Tax=Phlebotomus argentipes TaxID=94469 RepID=UPI0028934706|nr:glutathione S-transferase D7 [Phlebotomus argentipes]
MPVKLYYLPESPPCRVVLLCGRLLDINFDLKTVNVLNGEQLKADFIQMNPQHCIPTMEDNDLVLWESRVILMYLVSAYAEDDTLYPKDLQKRAMVDQRIQFDLGTLYQRAGDYFFPTMFVGAPLDETKKARLAEALGWMEEILKGRTWIATEDFTIADLTICVTISQIEAFDFELGPYPKVRAWFQLCKDKLEPFGYNEINQAGADALGKMFRSKLL